MTSYFVGHLTSSSTLEDRERLRRALMATPGVAHVTLTPSRGEISISFRANTPVARNILATTISGAGFELRMPTTRFTDG
jgi:hypothetical protein